MDTRRILINGREVEVPSGEITVRELRRQAKVPPERIIAKVADEGTMQKLADDEAAGPEDRVFVVLPNFGYGC